MVVVTGGGVAQDTGTTVFQGFDEFAYVLTGANIHISRNPAVEAVADTDIFDVAAAVYDEVHFICGLLRCVADLKFPCAATVLLKNVAPGGGKNSRYGNAYHSHDPGGTWD